MYAVVKKRKEGAQRWVRYSLKAERKKEREFLPIGSRERRERNEGKVR